MQPKCQIYWPALHEEIEFGSIRVTTVGDPDFGLLITKFVFSQPTLSLMSKLSAVYCISLSSDGHLPPLLPSPQTYEENISNDFVIRDLMAECDGVSAASLVPRLSSSCLQYSEMRA